MLEFLEFMELCLPVMKAIAKSGVTKIENITIDRADQSAKPAQPDPEVIELERMFKL